MKKVLAFGVFDGLHKGHESFLRQAKRRGDFLLVALARDEIVKKLKGRKPRKSLKERAAHLRRVDHVDEIVTGDAEIGSYKIVLRHRPRIIALGYDQKKLAADLRKNYKKFSWRPKIIFMKPHRPRRYHSHLVGSGS